MTTPEIAPNPPAAPGQGGAPAAAAPPAGALPAAPLARPTASPRVDPLGRMGDETLAARLRRAEMTANKRWTTELGVEDPATVKQQLAELAQLKQLQQEAERAKLSELDRYKADIADRDAKLAALNAELVQEREKATYANQDAQVRSLAAEVIAPRFIKAARVDFAEYLGSLSPAQQKRITEREVKAWFSKYAKENPDFAAQAGTPAAGGTKTTPAAGAKPVVRRPLSNGVSPRGPGAASITPGSDPSVAGGKTVKPGKANSMSREEVRAFAATQGVRMP